MYWLAWKYVGSLPYDDSAETLLLSGPYCGPVALIFPYRFYRILSIAFKKALDGRPLKNIS